MAQYILHKDGAYNIFSTISDGAFFEGALTLEQLRAYIKEEFGNGGLQSLPERLARAHKTGCSSQSGLALSDAIANNHAGPEGAPMPHDEFVARYLTLAPVLASSSGGQ